MASYPRNYPFYNWVPKPVGILILFVFFLPILTIGGTYSVASAEMISGLGIISEHFQFASFATSIGMAAFCPFLYRLVVIRRQKMMCITGFSLMYIFSYICAKTDSVFLLALCSIFMGFLRMVLMMVNLFTLIKYAGNIEAYDKITPGNEPDNAEGWDKLDVDRSIAQPGIYLFFMVLGQLGTSLTAWLAYEYEWQYIHYFMMGLLLLCILVTFVTMPYRTYVGKRFPINFKQFGDVSIFCIALACITYVLTYGKVLDWYDDSTIRWATVGGLISIGLFLYLESAQHNPYYQLDVFKLRTIRMGFLFYFLLMVLNSSSMFVNVFTSIGMKLDNFQNATLGNWSMLGYLIGGIAVIWLSAKKVHFKYLFAAGFLFIGLSAMFMYFEVQSAGLYERMKYPIIIRSTGMMLLYSLIPTYATQRMPYKYLSSWICTMLTVRMVLAPSIGAALYSNVMQHRQQHYITRLSHDTDLVSPEAAASYTGTIRGMMYQGKSPQEAEQMAALSAKGKVQVQATLVTVKEMSGWTFYACLGCALFVVFLPYHKRKLPGTNVA
ncbi:MFS transporter [uncultured Bacteroides sp.]|uniref:MFS transporter n=1 Tax=uncultured Bacteroides sp. TaxID=162156 RepID=UPI002593A756|nr:MFS transporter [uncultured Bacteroides sp.]